MRRTAIVSTGKEPTENPKCESYNPDKIDLFNKIWPREEFSLSLKQNFQKIGEKLPGSNKDLSK